MIFGNRAIWVLGGSSIAQNGGGRLAKILQARETHYFLGPVPAPILGPRARAQALDPPEPKLQKKKPMVPSIMYQPIYW